MMWGKRVVIAGAAVGILGSLWKYQHNNYDANSLGFVRLARAGVTVSRVAYHYKTNLYSKEVDPHSPEYDTLRSKVHTDAAKMLLDLCCANQGVYIKVGQHIGTLEYLLPREYVEVMKVLHSNAPSSSFPDILKVLKQDFQCDPYEIFSSIEPEPLGTASLAQVHKGVLRNDGSIVAIKVQHPLVLRNSETDMKTMEVMVKVASSIFKDFRFQWLVDITKINLPKELDFRHEAENAIKAKEMLSCFDWLKVPTIYLNLTTKRVLTMEFLDGNKVTDIDYIKENAINRSKVTSHLSEMYAHMIFRHGFVHSDPHPGNILLHARDGKLNVILLDHGLYGVLSDDFRLNYSKFWMSILSRDLDGMKAHSQALGIGDLYPLLVCMVTGRSWKSVTGGIDRIQFTCMEKDDFQREIPNFLSRIGIVLQSVNQQMLLILKTNDLLRGIEHILGTHQRQGSFITMTRVCIDNIYDEQIKNCKSRFERTRLRISKLVQIVKVNLYYSYLTLLYWANNVIS